LRERAVISMFYVMFPVSPLLRLQSICT